MLWYKMWYESRWRFVAGLLVVIALAVVSVCSQPLILRVAESFQGLEGRIGQAVREGIEQARDYRVYVWVQWWRKDLLQLWTLLAILIAAGGLTTERLRGSALFTLALPVTRRRLLAVRAATGVAELFVLALAPALAIPAVSPLIGQRYGLGEALLYSLFLFCGGLAVYGFVFLLSTVFSDQLKPIAVALCAVIALGALWRFFDALAPYSLYKVMTAESYFYRGVVPWQGALVALALAMAMFYWSLRITERRDF